MLCVIFLVIDPEVEKYPETINIPLDSEQSLQDLYKMKFRDDSYETNDRTYEAYWMSLRNNDTSEYNGGFLMDDPEPFEFKSISLPETTSLPKTTPLLKPTEQKNDAATETKPLLWSTEQQDDKNYKCCCIG